MRSPLFTAVTGKFALHVLEADATAPALARATFVGVVTGGGAFTVCESAAEVAAAKSASPEYWAVIECTPSVRPLVVHVTRPAGGMGCGSAGAVANTRGVSGKALAAILSTGRYLGLGLGSLVNAIDPSLVYIGGEITAAWDLIEDTVRAALAERALTPSAGATPIVIVPPEQYPRLRGAAALVAAPSFAKEVVA